MTRAKTEAPMLPVIETWRVLVKDPDDDDSSPAFATSTYVTVRAIPNRVANIPGGSVNAGWLDLIEKHAGMSCRVQVKPTLNEHYFICPIVHASRGIELETPAVEQFKVKQSSVAAIDHRGPRSL
jgi:hypothetical protein